MGWLSLSSFAYHPVHVAVINIDIPSGKKEIDVTFKVFSNDIELAVVHNFSVPLFLGTKQEKTENLKYINNYISACFSMRINNKYTPKLVYLRKETSDDATWLYYSASIPEDFREMTLKNQVLLDIYEDQTNLVIISENDKQTGFKMNYKEQTIEYDLN